MNSSNSSKRRVSLDISEELLTWLDELKSQFGLRSRGAILEQVLREVRHQGPEDDEDGDASPLVSDVEALESSGSASSGSRLLDETLSLVLIRSSRVREGDQACIPDANRETSEVGPLVRGGSSPGAPTPAGRNPGIQLPGFVRRQARELGRSLQPPVPAETASALSLITPAQLEEALHRADQHWSEVYGQAAQDSVLEAAMIWLARDVWPRSDHSDGRPFTWNLTQQVVLSFAVGWEMSDPTLPRVITAAGVLEDPFSASTLGLRIPTLMTRFVQWHRSRQKRTTSFEAIDQTMTVHAALRLLQLPAIADRPYSLKDIRDAYRVQAQCHHPDAGGSADAMRRLNEAYQFLKDRYRRAA